MIKKLSFATAIAAVATAAVTATALATGNPDSQLSQMVEAEEATAALSYDGEYDSAGAADLDSGDPVDPRGHFRIGSVTKTFVATVTLQLVDEGQLDIDDPVETHLPAVVPNGENITVRQILNHTSGLYDYMSVEGYSTNRWRGEARFDSYTPRELLDVAFAHDPHFSPGEDWRYSNTNYIVAGSLIEEITGNSYQDEVRQRILRPLDMGGTALPGEDPSVPEPHARGYTLVDDEVVDATEQNPTLDWAAGEMTSTAADLRGFLAALQGGELLSADSLSEMRATLDTGTMFDYGLGLQSLESPCGSTLYGHGGELLGYVTYALADDNGRTMVVSFNPGTQPADPQRLNTLLTEAFCQ